MNELVEQKTAVGKANPEIVSDTLQELTKNDGDIRVVTSDSFVSLESFLCSISNSQKH